jgi:hypothetical protein
MRGNGCGFFCHSCLAREVLTRYDQVDLSDSRYMRFLDTPGRSKLWKRPLQQICQRGQCYKLFCCSIVRMARCMLGFSVDHC